MNETLIHLLPKEYNATSAGIQRSEGNEGKNSILTVLGTEVTNGTQYRCGLLDLQTNSILIVNFSDPVLLKVQGGSGVLILSVGIQ